MTDSVAGTAALSAGSNNATTTFSGTLKNGPGILALSKTGTGTLTLSGTNTYSGATTVGVGTLQAGSTTALSANSDFTVTSTLDLNGHSNTIGSLAGNGTITNSGAGATLSVGGDNVSSVFSGTLQNGPGALALTKSGTGTLILSGTSTYSGLTDVKAGLLSVRGTLSNSAVQVESGATLGGNGTISGAVAILSGGILSPGNSPGTLTVGSLVLNTGSFSNFDLGPAGVVGGGTNDLVIVNGNLTLGGTLNISDLGNFGSGVYRLFTDGTLTNNTMTIGTIPAGVTRAALSIQTSVANQVNLVVNGSSLLEFWDGPTTTATGTVTGGNGTWDNSTTNWTVSDGSTNSAWKQGLAVFDGTAGTVTLGANVTMAGMEFMTTGYVITTSNGSTITAAAGTTLQALSAVTGTIGAPIVGAGDVTANGPGTVILTAANTYTGGTTISGGTLQLGNGGTTGSITGNITDNGTLNLNRTDAVLTLTGNISGTGSVIQAGTGSSTLSGNNTYTGATTVSAGILILTGTENGSNGTTISAGTLQLGNATTTGSITGNITDNGVLQFSRTDAGLNLAGNINGTGSVIQAGTGSSALSGTNTYNGVTTVSAGTLQARSLSALSPNSDFTVNAILDLNGFSSAIGSLAGTGTVTNNGAAAVTLTAGGDNATTTFDGVLQDGTAAAATLALNKTGTGDLILTGNDTYSGLTDVQAGKFTVQGNLYNSNVQVESGATLSGAGNIWQDVTIEPGGILSPGDPRTLTFHKDLLLTPGSVTTFNLGTPGTVGSGVNDLINVTDNLTLAGTLNIVNAGGFGAGVYRLFNYGTLTNDGLAFGTLPAGVTPAELTIQTSVPNQINLVVTSNGTLFEFWDGTNVVENGTVNGGTGTWDTANTNWTNVNGNANSVWSPGFAVFEGAAGTVTLAANMTITGLQFVTDGYLITTTNGSVLTASTGTILEADSGVSGTVGVQITGAGDVTKTGLGTVILAATNTYTGGTSVTAGNLVVAANQALGTGAVSIDGTTSLLQVNAGAGITNPVTLLDSGSVTNAGTIGGNAWGLTGISGNSTIINSGTITGQQGGITLATAGTITNTGTISGGPTGILLAQGGTVTNAAGAMINGALTATGGSTTLTNAGTIHGDVTLSNNANLVTLFIGSQIQGLLNLGSSAGSQLVLDGAGTQPSAVRSVAGSPQPANCSSKDRAPGCWISRSPA